MKLNSYTPAILLLLLVSGCAKLTLAWADLDPRSAPARPPLIAVEQNGAEAWQSETASLQSAFEEHVYGRFPDASETVAVSHRVLDAAAFSGAGVLEEYELSATLRFDDEMRETNRFYVDVLLPANAQGPSPIILMETFCPRWDTVVHPDVMRPEGAGSCNTGRLSGLMRYVFGRYIATPPVEAILSRGYGIAAIYPGEVVPDARTEGLAALSDLAAGNADNETRWGAVGAWAWVYSRVIDVLEADERIDQNGLVTWGHSRYAKSALVAAAFDPRIDGVIAHQSGTGGASLNRDKPGESIKSITSAYPHWFSKRYASYAGREDAMPIDQHQLLALIAPRPILLGNARRDVWSDPVGAFKAALGADPAYKLMGSNGLQQDTLESFIPEADIAFWIRPGTHGVVKEDWPAFLDFLDAHFGGLESVAAK